MENTRETPALQAKLHPTSSTSLSTTSPTFLVSCGSFRSLPISTLAEFKAPVSCIAILNSVITFDFYFSMLSSVFHCSFGLTSTSPPLNIQL